MNLNWIPRPILRAIVWLYQQVWFHWYCSIVLSVPDTIFGLIYRAEAWMFQTSLWKDWQSRQLPKFPIGMGDGDIPVKPERSDACGQYVATMICTYADAAELAGLLPADAELDPAHIHDGKHAIIYMLGYTENLHRVWNPLPGINYMEFAVGIPSIRIKRSGGYDFPFFYLPTLWLSRFYPVVMGWMVGYRKHWGWVSAKDKTYHIHRLFGRPILSASFAVEETQPARLMGGPKVEHWRDLLNQPHANPFGKDEFLYLHYHWDWPDALLQPVSADVEVFEKLPGLPPGKYHFEPLNLGEWIDLMAPIGAFRLCAPFELLSPFDRKALGDWRMMMGLVPAQTPPGGAPPASGGTSPTPPASN